MKPPFSGENKRRFTGAIIGIPIDSRICQAVVVWHSAYFKNVILVAATDLLIASNEQSLELGNILGLWFTGAQLIRKGYWKYQGGIKVCTPEEVITFYSAGDRWIGDERVGEWGDEPANWHLSVAGALAVQREIGQLIAGGPVSRQAKEGQRLAKKYEAQLTSRCSGPEQARVQGRKGCSDR
jgi:hypothetical protein